VLCETKSWYALFCDNYAADDYYSMHASSAYLQVCLAVLCHDHIRGTEDRCIGMQLLWTLLPHHFGLNLSCNSGAYDANHRHMSSLHQCVALHAATTRA
jgi:hypothetical protein